MADAVTARSADDWTADFNPWASSQHTGQVPFRHSPLKHHSSMLERQQHPPLPQQNPSQRHLPSSRYPFSSQHPSSSQRHHSLSQHHPSLSQQHPSLSQHYPSLSQQRPSLLENDGLKEALPMEPDSSGDTATPSEQDVHFSRSSFSKAVCHVNGTADHAAGLFASKLPVSKSASDEVSQTNALYASDMQFLDDGDHRAMEPTECAAPGVAVKGDRKGPAGGAVKGDRKRTAWGAVKGDKKRTSGGAVKGDRKGPARGVMKGDSKGPAGGAVKGDSKGAAGGGRGDAVKGDSKGPAGGVEKGDSKGPTGGAVKGDDKGTAGGAVKGDGNGPAGGAVKSDSNGPAGGAVKGDDKGPAGGAVKGDGNGPAGGAVKGDDKAPAGNTAEAKAQSIPAVSCHFHDRTSVQALVRLSEDIRFFKQFYLVHAKCAILSSRPFGPWCSGTTSRRRKRSGLSCSKPSKDSPSGEKIFWERPLQTSPVKNEGAASRPNPDGASNDSEASVKEKHAKNVDVFDRLSGQSVPYLFRHLADVRDYISEYREQCTVGLVGRKLKRAPVLGVDVPDPYSCKKKHPCTCIQCSPLSQSNLVRGPREGAGPESGSSGSGKGNSSADKHVARAVPTLAPVRQTTRRLTPPADTKPTPAELPRPASDPDYLPSLVLPSIQLAQESKRLTMVGRSPATQHPKDNQATFWSTQSDSNADEGKGKSKKRAGVKDGRKKGPVKLKYTNRPPVVNASDGATREPNTASLKGCEPSASPARSASKDDAAVPQHVHITEPIPKPGTEKNEDLGSHKEPWLPGLVRKELTEEEPQRGLTFYRGRYATFTQAQKVYESKRNLGGVKRLVHGEPTSIDSDQRLLQGARRSLSVDVTVDSQDVRERDWKSWLSSGSSKKNGFLRVRVACVEGLPTRLVLEGKQQYVPSGEPARHVPPSTVSDPHLHAQQGLGTGASETEGKDSDVVASLPRKEQRDTDTLQVETDGKQEKQEQSQNSTSQEEVGKNKGSTIHVTKPAEVSCDRLKQHKDFSSRTRPKKGTSFKVSRNVMTNSPDDIKMSESMAIRGKTMTELANSHLSSRGILTNNENNSTMKESIDMKDSTPETAEQWQSSEDPDTAEFREKTNAKSPVKPTTRPNPLSNGGKNHKNLCDQKGVTVRRTVRRGGPSVSSTYPGSLVITGGATRPEADEGPMVDRKEGGKECPSSGDAHPVTLEFRLGKEEGLSSDRPQPVTVVR